jgi:hypothetical protein
MGSTKVDKILQSGAVATGNGNEFDISSYGAVGFQVTGITSATITFEATVNGTDWVSIQAANTATGARSATATADGVYTAPVAGLQRVRARISTYATGTIYVTALASTEAAVDSVAQAGRIGVWQVHHCRGHGDRVSLSRIPSHADNGNSTGRHQHW